MQQFLHFTPANSGNLLKVLHGGMCPPYIWLTKTVILVCF
jgi:hypothetical protein